MMGVFHYNSKYGSIISDDGVFPPGNTLEIVLDGSVHNLHSLLNTPMTRDRSLEELFKTCPQFETDINSLPKNATIGDFGCGTGNAVCALTEQFPNCEIIALDQEVPLENLVNAPHIRWIQGDIENNISRDALKNESLDYVYSFFTSMYLQDPFTFLVNIQKKLKTGGTALVHLGYTEQYASGLKFITEQLYNLQTGQVRVGDEMFTELLFAEHDEKKLFVGNALANLEPIFVRFGKEDDLTTIDQVQSSSGFFIEYAGSRYKLRHSEKWYTYNTQ